MPTTTDRCPCGQPAETQYLRHLTAAEYAALPDSLRPIDGYAVRPEPVCGDCHPGPLCTHPAADPVPCPDCHAQPGQPCTKPDGTPRPVEHPARALAQPTRDTCRHAHRETCTDPRQCQCTDTDEPPQRQPGVPLEPPPIDLRAIPQALELIDRYGLRPELVCSEVRIGWTQDNRKALIFDYAQADNAGHPARDVHGHKIVQQRVIPIDQR